MRACRMSCQDSAPTQASGTVLPDPAPLRKGNESITNPSHGCQYMLLDGTYKVLNALWRPGWVTLSFFLEMKKTNTAVDGWSYFLAQLG